MGSPPSALPTPVKSKIELKPLPASRQTQSMPKTRPNSRRLLKLTSTNTPIWLKLKARNTESNSIWTLFTPASKNNTIEANLQKNQQLKNVRKTAEAATFEGILGRIQKELKNQVKNIPNKHVQKSLNSIVTQGAKEASKAMKANGLNGNIQNKVKKEFNQKKGPALKKLAARQKQAVKQLNKKIDQQKF